MSEGLQLKLIYELSETMNYWIPVLTGILAFIGAIAGHFVAFDLTAAAKRREVRRQKIDELATLICEDETWLFKYRHEQVFGGGNTSLGGEPADRAHAIYMLYFDDELSESMSAFIEARHEFKKTIDEVYMARIDDALANGRGVAATRPNEERRNAVAEKFTSYYSAYLSVLNNAGVVCQKTIPKNSKIVAFFKGD